MATFRLTIARCALAAGLLIAPLGLDALATSVPEVSGDLPRDLTSGTFSMTVIVRNIAETDFKTGGVYDSVRSSSQST